MNSRIDEVASRFVAFLETGKPDPALFTPDVFLDFTLPQWRIQARGLEDVVGVRLHGHPGPGKVPRWSVAPTPTGFVMELEERWTDAKDDWYCREVVIAHVDGGSINRLSVYCTGDWDSARQALHSTQVQLLEP